MRAEGMKKLLSLDARGTFGRGGGFGRVALGYNFFGFYSEYSGIYQKKYYYGVPYISKMKFYRPTNPQTPAQQNWRAIFAYGWILWRDLTDEEREYYRIQGKKMHMGPANAFMKVYLKRPDLWPV